MTEGVTSLSDMESRIGIYLGLDQEISTSSLGDQVPEHSTLYFKFKCDNPSTVVESLQETAEAFKEFLGEINEELKPIIEMIEFNFLTLDDGAAMTVNLDTHPMLGPYAQMVAMSTEPVKDFEPRASIELGSGKYISDPNPIGGGGFFRINFNSKSVVDAVLNNNLSAINKEMEGQLEVAIKKKLGIEVSTFLSLLNAKSLDLTLEMYKVDEKNVGFNANLKELLSGLLQSQSENPMLAVVRSMEFLKDYVSVLRENNMSELTIGVSLGHIHAKVQLALDVGFVFDLLFAEEED